MGLESLGGHRSWERAGASERLLRPLLTTKAEQTSHAEYDKDEEEEETFRIAVRIGRSP